MDQKTILNLILSEYLNHYKDKRVNPPLSESHTDISKKIYSGPIHKLDMEQEILYEMSLRPCPDRVLVLIRPFRPNGSVPIPEGIAYHNSIGYLISEDGKSVEGPILKEKTIHPLYNSAVVVHKELLKLGFECDCPEIFNSSLPGGGSCSYTFNK